MMMVVSLAQQGLQQEAYKEDTDNIKDTQQEAETKAEKTPVDCDSSLNKICDKTNEIHDDQEKISNLNGQIELNQENRQVIFKEDFCEKMGRSKKRSSNQNQNHNQSGQNNKSENIVHVDSAGAEKLKLKESTDPKDELSIPESVNLNLEDSIETKLDENKNDNQNEGTKNILNGNVENSADYKSINSSIDEKDQVLDENSSTEAVDESQNPSDDKESKNDYLPQKTGASNLENDGNLCQIEEKSLSSRPVKDENKNQNAEHHTEFPKDHVQSLSEHVDIVEEHVQKLSEHVQRLANEHMQNSSISNEHIQELASFDQIEVPMAKENDSSTQLNRDTPDRSKSMMNDDEFETSNDQSVTLSINANSENETNDDSQKHNVIIDHPNESTRQVMMFLRTRSQMTKKGKLRRYIVKDRRMSGSIASSSSLASPSPTLQRQENKNKGHSQPVNTSDFADIRRKDPNIVSPTNSEKKHQRTVSLSNGKEPSEELTSKILADRQRELERKRRDTSASVSSLVDHNRSMSRGSRSTPTSSYRSHQHHRRQYNWQDDGKLSTISETSNKGIVRKAKNFAAIVLMSLFD